VFANTGTTGVSTITAGAGSADIGLGGKSVDLVIGPASTPHTLALYNFVPGADMITLSGLAPAAGANALATQAVNSGSTVLSIDNSTTVILVGVTHAAQGLFG